MSKKPIVSDETIEEIRRLAEYDNEEVFVASIYWGKVVVYSFRRGDYTYKDPPVVGYMLKAGIDKQEIVTFALNVCYVAGLKFDHNFKVVKTGQH